MRHSELSTLKQLSNYLRCEEEYLTTFFNSYISVNDNKTRTISNINISIVPTSEEPIVKLMRLYIPKKNLLYGYRVVYKVHSDEFSNILKILNTYLSLLYIPNVAVHGFVTDRNIRTNAMNHLSKNYVLSIDIKDYFETITSSMIINSLCELGFKKNISEYLSKLMTIDDKLCQGYNTSPTIANIVSQNLDLDLLDYSGKDITYTRYADDLYFSSNKMNPNVLDLEKVVNKHGFELNPIKTKLMKRGSKQYVTGLSVFDSQFPRISKRIKRNLKLEIYYLNKFGFVSHTCKMLNYTNEEYNNSSLVQREVNNVINSIKHRIGGWLCFMHSIEPQATAKLFVLYKSALDKEKANVTAP